MCSISATCSTVYACTVPHLLRSWLAWVVKGSARRGGVFSVTFRCRLAFVSACASVPLRAEARERVRRDSGLRRSLWVILLGRTSAPAPPADLDGLAGPGVLGQVPVEGGSAHAGRVHQVGNRAALFGSQ